MYLKCVHACMHVCAYGLFLSAFSSLRRYPTRDSSCEVGGMCLSLCVRACVRVCVRACVTEGGVMNTCKHRTLRLKI